MALALDGHVTGTHSSGASFTSAALTTANANDIIAVVAATSAGSTAITITSVTASGVSGLALRKALGTGTTTKKDMELWYGTAAAALSSVTFTINLSGTPTAAGCSIFGISGANTTTKTDSNAVLPGTATGSGVPTITGMSTSNANDFIICASDVGTTPFTQTAGAGFTLIDTIAPGTSLGIATEYQIVSATQSSVSWAFGTAPSGNWGMIADAVIAAAAAGISNRIVANNQALVRAAYW